MKGVEATPEEQERLATGNNNGSLDTKLPPEAQRALPRSAFYSTRVFMLVFLSGWVLQGMFLTYFVSVTTTLEKLYKVESKTTGTLLAATEIGQICTALFLTYLAGRGHRPRWIACMMLVLAVGVIGCVLPHLLYGTELLNVHMVGHTSGAAPVCNLYNNMTFCDRAQQINTETRSSITAVVIPWLFVCLLVVGVGQTGIATLGIPYVDDNVGSRQSPLYMAITIGIRVIGPALGFLLGAFCTRIYVNPLGDPGFDFNDPKWVGAWWLGMVFIAGFVVLLSTLMFFFPRQIKQEPLPPPPMKSKDRREPFFKDFFATIKRQLTNDILMWRTASSVLHLMPISGVYSFLPKYLEKQFRLPTHDANIVSGLGGILVMGLGIITSGVVILKLVPSARRVAAWTAATAAIYSAGMVVLMFVSCPEKSYRFFTPGLVGDSVLKCSSDCHCDNTTFNPVCGQDAFTYLSPCQAGCMESKQLDNSTWLYYNCSCIDSNSRGVRAMSFLDSYHLYNTSDDILSGPEGFAVTGECGGPCNQIYIFIAIFAAIMFVHASGEVGAVLLIIRCTDKHDKAMAMGVIQFAIGVFGNVPCPIVFGAAVDAACRARDAACDALGATLGATPGACAHYDADAFRYFYLGLSAGIMFLAFIMDMLVWSKAGRIDMNPGERGERERGRGEAGGAGGVEGAAPTPALLAPLRTRTTRPTRHSDAGLYSHTSRTSNGDHSSCHPTLGALVYGLQQCCE
ncbi:solute carrier organic anion transporter family member 74D-like [Manduca sexta]|uniref:solute carrier organic anion transporter family member 74D-like n=1 Tax=Manduca sexta TaxID=7130 RepID=UPI00188F312C|nr:solute carrier organic anion transporter family member 74D-like [Manduca sexta]